MNKITVTVNNETDEKAVLLVGGYSLLACDQGKAYPHRYEIECNPLLLFVALRDLWLAGIMECHLKVDLNLPDKEWRKMDAAFTKSVKAYSRM